jgi:arylsulfatase A-like enzyme
MPPLSLRTALAAAGVLLLTAPAAPAQDAPAKKPNVLFIAVDDLNDWVEPLGGHPQVKTPNIRRLAERGVTFTRAYCSAPACNPSRASLLCGVLPSTSGVYHNDQAWRPVLKDAVTLPQHFMAHGYTVRGFGKIFHGSYNDPASWHEYQRPGPFAQPATRPANGIPNTAHFDWGPVDATDAQMGDTQTVDRGIAVLQQKHDRPFFLAVGAIRPHLPFYAPKEYFDLYPLESIQLPGVKKDDLADVPAEGVRMARPQGDHRKVIESNNWQKAVQAYLACITYTDRQIGRLLDALEKSPHAKDTVVILWSDHGWHLGEKEHWRKFALWEEATRVVMIASAPGVTTPGTRCDRTVSLLDLYPTLTELCGLAPKKELEGRSLVPLLKDPAASWDRPVVTTHGRLNHAVRNERWRYIRYHDGSEELYDHQSDPQEWTNLAAKPELSSVKAELAQWLPKVNAPNAPRERAKAKGREE